MDISRYGPFANIVAIGCALAAVFSALLVRMIGNRRHWTWVDDDALDSIVTAGARMLAVIVMAVTYVTIDKQNSRWFMALGLICGVAGFYLVSQFLRLRNIHLLKIPEVGPDGQQAVDEKGKLIFRYLVIGREADLRDDNKEKLEAARKKHGFVSLESFLMGAGAEVGKPEALWNRELLANISSKLSLTLMSIFLLGVVTLFLAAFIVEVSG